MDSMTVYLCNGLSKSMLRDPNTKQINYPLTLDEFREIILNTEFTSVIGHHDLADVLTMICGTDIPYNRKGITLHYEDLVLLVSLNGRLAENPTYVEIKNRINFSFVRFEKQTIDDMLKSQKKIEEIMEEI